MSYCEMVNYKRDSLIVEKSELSTDDRIEIVRSNLHGQRKSIYDTAIDDIKWYANEYGCSMKESFNDWEGEAPADPWLFNALNEAIA